MMPKVEHVLVALLLTVYQVQPLGKKQIPPMQRDYEEHIQFFKLLIVHLIGLNLWRQTHCITIYGFPNLNCDPHFTYCLCSWSSGGYAVRRACGQRTRSRLRADIVSNSR